MDESDRGRHIVSILNDSVLPMDILMDTKKLYTDSEQEEQPCSNRS
jgi:hypothetical protein